MINNLAFIIAGIVLFSIVTSSIFAAEDSTMFPNWFKNSARLWLEGQLSDEEFADAIKWLIDNGYLQINSLKQDEVNEQTLQKGSFSNIVCTQEYSYVQMTGKYTNGDVPYQVIFLKMMLFDDDKNALATGSSIISDVDAHVTKYFDVVTRFTNMNYTSCEVQIDSAIPKNR